MRHLWAGVVGYSLRYGAVTTTATRAGGACFLGPGRAHVTAWRELWGGLRLTRALLLLPAWGAPFRVTSCAKSGWESEMSASGC